MSKNLKIINENLSCFIPNFTQTLLHYDIDTIAFTTQLNSLNHANKLSEASIENYDDYLEISAIQPP